MKKLLGYILIAALTSCSNSEKEPKKSDYEIEADKRKQLKNYNEKEVYRLSQKHDAVNNWDTNTFFTYKLQEILNDTIITFTGYIADIIKNDNDIVKKIERGEMPPLPKGYEAYTYLLKIYSSKSEYIAEISITDTQLKRIEKEVSKKNDRKGCFVFKVNRITSMFPVLSAEGDADINGGNEEDGYDYEVNSYLTYEYEKVLLKFTGTLIDYYVYTKEIKN